MPSRPGAEHTHKRWRRKDHRLGSASVKESPICDSARVRITKRWVDPQRMEAEGTK